jgi:hypothetical protein
MLGAISAAILLAATASAASAACREDLVTTSQTLKRTREGLENAAKGTAAAKCVAYRQHIASLNAVRTVFARCDTSADKAKNAAQVSGTIATATKEMQANCAVKKKQ